MNTKHKQHELDHDRECPLCMESLDLDDLGFFPCSCGYQVCRFCWHRLKNDDNGLCPACRQAYPDSPIQFSQISIETVEELKKRKKKQKEKQKLKDATKSQNLSSVRVVQKNLLFVIGLPQRLSQDDLRKEFIKYGKILKMVINASSAYVTYARPEDAVAAIKSLNEANQTSNKSNQRNAGNNQTQQTLRASLGTTKYCTHWLRSQNCPKQPDCMYLHEMADPEASFTKEEMQVGKHTEYEKRLIQYYLDLLSKEKDQKLNRKNQTNSQSFDEKIESKTILIQNGSQNTQKDRQFQEINDKNSGNAFGGDETSNDSVGNGESGDSTAHSASPVIPCRWGTPNSSLSSNSESNSLSSTPNQTLGGMTSQQHMTGQTSKLKSQTTGPGDHQTFGLKSGEILNNIDDNAVDAQLLSNGLSNGLIEEEDSSGEDITADDEQEDDGLDFDPISISSRGLQDLLRDSSQTTAECLLNNVFNSNTNNEFLYSNQRSALQSHQNNGKQNFIQNLSQNQIQNNLSFLSKQQFLNTNGYTNHSQQQHQNPVLQRSGFGSQSGQTQGMPHNSWQSAQQQQNSLRQLLPNVNITFQHQSLQNTGNPKQMAGPLVGNGYINGLNLTSNSNIQQNSQTVIANSHLRQQQQTIGHQMGSQPVMGQTLSTGLPHIWPQQQREPHSREQHMIQLQRQQQQQYHNHRLYGMTNGQHLTAHPHMSAIGVGAAPNRPPPPGF